MEVTEMESSSSCLSSSSGQDIDLPSLNWLQNISFAPPTNGSASLVSNLPQSQPTRLQTRSKQNHQQPRNKTITKTATHVTVNIDGYKVSGDKKPPFSYATLICMALCRNDNKMTLAEIYQWISENFLFYHNQDKSWQKSIRHNLSLNKCFIKIARSKNEPGKGGFWSLDLKRLEESRRSKRCSTLTVRKKKAILHTKSSRKKLKNASSSSNGKKPTSSRPSTPSTSVTVVTPSKKKEKKHNILSNISVCGGTEVKRKQSKTNSNSDFGVDSIAKTVLEKPQIVPDHESVLTPIQSPVNDPSVIETIIDNEFIFDDKFISSNGQTMIFNDVDLTTFLAENDVEWTDDNLLLLDPLFNDF